MFETNDHERGKLILLAQDKTTLEGLKKVFLRSFLRKREGDVYAKAAASYATDFLEEAFRDLETMIEKEKAEQERKNIV